jgi:hypothetical protein
MRPVLWVAACAVLIVALGGASVPAWLLALVVVIAIASAVPLSIDRYRRDRNLVRAFWRLLTPR